MKVKNCIKYYEEFLRNTVFSQSSTCLKTFDIMKAELLIQKIACLGTHQLSNPIYSASQLQNTCADQNYKSATQHEFDTTRNINNGSKVLRFKVECAS